MENREGLINELIRDHIKSKGINEEISSRYISYIKDILVERLDDILHGEFELEEEH